PLRVGLPAAVLGVHVVGCGLSDQAAAAALSGARMSVFTPQLAPEALPPGAPKKNGRGRRSSPLTWRWGDRLALAAAWIAGLGLCLIAASIVLYMGYRGIQYLRPGLLFSRPAPGTSQKQTGGILDPIL